MEHTRIRMQNWTFLLPGIYEIQTPYGTLVKKCHFHPSLWFRTKGLLGRRYLQSDEGILLKPCNGIHTFFMQFPIDLVFIDKAGKITRMYENFKPWRMTLPSFKDHATIELAAHTLKKIEGIEQGTPLSIIPVKAS